LEPDEIQRLFFQLLDILDFAHGKGITHRSIEIDSILWYAEDGRIKLVDFKAMDDIDDDPATDMLALGTTIFLLATGASIAENLEWNYCETVSKFHCEVYDSLGEEVRERWERLPDAFRGTIETCLVSDPTKRPSVAELLSQPDMRELRATQSRSFGSTGDDDNQPTPLRPATLPSALLSSSPIYKGAPITDIDSSDCVYAPSPSLRPDTPTKPDNVATSSSFYSNVSAVSADSSRCDFYPSSAPSAQYTVSHLQRQAVLDQIASARNDEGIADCDDDHDHDHDHSRDRERDITNSSIGDDRPQREHAMVLWLRSHCPYICPENVPVYATRFYEDNASAIERVARR
jgi:serine/threonine protein kinase